MKITTAIVSLSVALCASLCCSGEDDYVSNNLNIENNTIIQVEDNQNIFAVGDAIVIETIIELSQTTTTGQEISLADYDYSEPESAFRYYLALYKENAFGTISEIPLTNSNISSIEGNTTIENGYLFIEAFFTGVNYKNKVSITLAEEGTYYLAGSQFINSNDGKVNINGGIYELAFIDIHSQIVNSNQNGGFEFTVN